MFDVAEHSNLKEVLSFKNSLVAQHGFVFVNSFMKFYENINVFFSNVIFFKACFFFSYWIFFNFEKIYVFGLMT